MADLLSTIRQNSQALAGQQQGVTDQSSQLSGLLRAKSGKDASATGGDVAASNLGEQQAVAQTNNTMRNQVAPAAQTQQAGLDQASQGQQQQLGQAKAQIAQTNKFNTAQSQIQTNSILQNFEQQKGQLSLDQDKAAANQVATNLRMQNNKYMDQLQLEGQKNRLDDSNQFRTHLQQSVLGDNQTLLQSKLGDQSILDASNRDFQRAMGTMDVGFAYEVFNNAAAGAKQAAVYGGAGALATAGIAGAGAMQESNAKSDYKDYSKSGGTDSYSTWSAKQ